MSLLCTELTVKRINTCLPNSTLTWGKEKSLIRVSPIDRAVSAFAKSSGGSCINGHCWFSRHSVCDEEGRGAVKAVKQSSPLAAQAP